MGRRSSEGGAAKVTWHDWDKKRAAEQIKQFKANEVGLKRQWSDTLAGTQMPCLCSQSWQHETTQLKNISYGEQSCLILRAEEMHVNVTATDIKYNPRIAWFWSKCEVNFWEVCQKKKEMQIRL